MLLEIQQRASGPEVIISGFQGKLNVRRCKKSFFFCQNFNAHYYEMMKLFVVAVNSFQ